MALEHHSTILCDYLIRADNGRFTFAGVFKNIAAKQFPTGKDPMGIYIECGGRVGDPWEVLMEGPKGFKLHLGEGQVENSPDAAEFQLSSAAFVVVASPMIFAEPGIYSIILRSKGRPIHRYDFGVFLSETKDE